ncbi:MAG: pectate lyase [Cyclobacteriaceae bacterium]
MMRFSFALLVLFLFSFNLFGQPKKDSIAEDMLIVQRINGGWPKHLQIRGKKDVKTNYAGLNLTSEERQNIKGDSAKLNTTYDNDATSKEIRHLLQAYVETGNKNYLQAAEKGIEYILSGQYPSGGWPQFYPLKGGYADDITYNDNAMVNCLNVLRDLVRSEQGFDVVDDQLRQKSKIALAKGVECILKTQILINGELTVWCAQHDPLTFKATNARSFELASLSGQESVGIIRFLMEIENPSEEVKNSIEQAMMWIDANKIEGYKIIWPEAPGTERGYDRVLVEAPGSVLWARFYDLETGKPFFCGRDGVKKQSMTEIEYERRVGYGWYGTWPEKLLNDYYPEWKKQNRLD